MIQVAKVHDDYNSLVHKDFTHQQAVYWTARWHSLKESTVEELLTVPVGTQEEFSLGFRHYLIPIGESYRD